MRLFPLCSPSSFPGQSATFASRCILHANDEQLHSLHDAFSMQTTTTANDLEQIVHKTHFHQYFFLHKVFFCVVLVSSRTFRVLSLTLICLSSYFMLRIQRGGSCASTTYPSLWALLLRHFLILALYLTLGAHSGHTPPHQVHLCLSACVYRIPVLIVWVYEICL